MEPDVLVKQVIDSIKESIRGRTRILIKLQGIALCAFENSLMYSCLWWVFVMCDTCWKVHVHMISQKSILFIKYEICITAYGFFKSQLTEVLFWLWFISISQWFSVWGYSITVGVIENSYILAMFVTMEIYSVYQLSYQLKFWN